MVLANVAACAGLKILVNLVSMQKSLFANTAKVSKNVFTESEIA